MTILLTCLWGCENSAFSPISPNDSDTVRIAIYDRSSRRLVGTVDVSQQNTISIENALEIPRELIREASEQDTLLIRTSGNFEGMYDELVLLYTGEPQDIPPFWSARFLSVPGGVQSTGGTSLGPTVRLFVFALDADSSHSGTVTIAIGSNQVPFQVHAERHTVVLPDPASVTLAEPTESALFVGAGALPDANPRILFFFEPSYYQNRHEMFSFRPNSTLGRGVGEGTPTLFAFAFRTP